MLSLEPRSAPNERLLSEPLKGKVLEMVLE